MAPEQLEIQLQAKAKQLAELLVEADRAITVLQERRSALISAAVTGQIDVRGFSTGGTDAGAQAASRERRPGGPPSVAPESEPGGGTIHRRPQASRMIYSVVVVAFIVTYNRREILFQRSFQHG
jgi:hypothetical protein